MNYFDQSITNKIKKFKIKTLRICLEFEIMKHLLVFYKKNKTKTHLFSKTHRSNPWTSIDSKPKGETAPSPKSSWPTPSKPASMLP